MQLKNHRQQHPESRTLKALTTSALALPGLAGAATVAHADTPVEDVTAQYSYSFYKEANLKTANFAASLGGSRERYKIHANQFTVVAPVTSQIDASFDFVVEGMAGASPWYVIPGPTPTEPLQVMTGATIQDTRIDSQFGVSHYFDRARISLTGGVSVEDDYRSGNFGFSAERNYNDKNTVISGGVSFSWDTIKPTDPTAHGHLPGAAYKKKTVGVYGNVSQLLTENQAIQFGLSYKNGQGYLSDPYKLVWFTGINAARDDTRPSTRNQVTLSAGYRYFVEPANASLQLDIQGYFDNWDVASFSTVIGWQQLLGERFQLIPSFRYYSQSQASFFSNTFVNPSLQPNFSSDYRLSPFGAIRAGLRGEAYLGQWPNWATWNAGLGYDFYWSSGDIALGRVRIASPGLVSYQLFTASLSGRF